jgi:hypothetical protein
MDTLHPSGRAPRPVRALHIQEKPHWQATAAVVAAVALYVTLPESLTVGPNWVLPVLEALLLPPLILTSDLSKRHRSLWQRFIFFSFSDESRFQRVVSSVLIAVINAANVASLVLLSYKLVHGDMHSGTELVTSAIKIWLTNVIVFGLWYWQLDRGGPGGRATHPHRKPDFLFPQLATPAAAPSGWQPGFVDYLYVAYTNATAFSPTDTMPLAGWAKLLMSVQAGASLLTAVLVLSRAVNILV